MIRALCRASVLVAAGATALAQAQAPASGDLSRVIHDYRTGHADDAVRTFALWTDDRVRAGASHAPRGADPWDTAALVLLHTEAGRLNGTFGDRRGAAGREPHYTIALALVQSLFDDASHRHDARLADFCGGWLVVAASTRAHQAWPPQTEYDLVQFMRRFGDQPDAQMLLGSEDERAMGPTASADVGSNSYAAPNEMTHPYVSTPFGVIDPAYANQAIGHYKKVLSTRPGFAEAELHWGRVLQLMNVTKDAAQELTQAAHDAAAAGDRATAYGAWLLLGEVADAEKRSSDALDAYRTAVALVPDAFSARVAVGESELAAGDVGGWRELQGVFGVGGAPAGTHRDVWADYQPALMRDVPARIQHLRSMVSIGAPPTPAPAPIVLTDRAASTAVAASPTTIRVDVDVSDDGAPVTGLMQADVDVMEGSTPARVTSFAPAGRVIAVLVVQTGHNAAVGWSSVQDAASAAVAAVAPSDSMLIISASDHPSAMARSNDRQTLWGALSGIHADATAGSALWDSLLAAESIVTGEAGRPVAIVVGDGEDDVSWADRSRIAEMLARNGISLIGVQAGGRAYSDVERTLGPLGKAGGMVLNVDDLALRDKLARRFAELRASYVLTFESASTRGVAHDVTVRLKNGKRGTVQTVSRAIQPEVRGSESDLSLFWVKSGR